MAAHGTAQRFDTGAAVAADWWQLFRSPQLDAMIREGISNNPGLAAAQASLRASQNELRSGYGIFFPSADAQAAAARERFSPASFGQGAASRVFNLFTLSASVNYALDVFGGQRRLVEGLRAQSDVAMADERATYIALAANIVNTAIAKAAYRDEIEATGQLIALQKEQVGNRPGSGRRRHGALLQRPQSRKPARELRGDDPAARAKAQPERRPARGSGRPYAGGMAGADTAAWTT